MGIDTKAEKELITRARKLSKRDIYEIPSIRENPISVILVKRFTKNERIMAKELVTTLYEFVNGENKLEILFKIYDKDGDGLISSKELFEILKDLNKGILDEWKIQNIVDKTFAKTGEYKLTLNMAEFKSIVEERSMYI